MSDRTRTRDNGCRGFFYSPRDRPQFHQTYDWQCPLGYEDHLFSPPRHRCHTTAHKNHLHCGTSLSVSTSRTWHPPSPPRGCRGLEQRGRDRRRPEGIMDRASPLPYRRDYHSTLTLTSMRYFNFPNPNPNPTPPALTLTPPPLP